MLKLIFFIIVIFILIGCAGIHKGEIISKSTDYDSPVFVNGVMYGPYKRYYILIDGVTKAGDRIARMKRISTSTYYNVNIGDSVFFKPFSFEIIGQ